MQTKILAMPKKKKEGTRLTWKNTTKYKTRRRTRKEGKRVRATDSGENPKECFLRCEQLSKNGNNQDRKQYKLISGPYWQVEPQNLPRHTIVTIAAQAQLSGRFCEDARFRTRDISFDQKTGISLLL